MVIYDRLEDSNSENSNKSVVEATGKHLETYADEGLRTLVIAYRPLQEDEYRTWSEAFRLANGDLEQLEKRKNGDLDNTIDTLMEEMERDLILLGTLFSMMMEEYS